MAENGVQATAKTSQIFLGMAVQCTQCHNHPFNEYKQNQFWELNAFFRQTRVERLEEDDERQTFAAAWSISDFRGEWRNPDKAEIYYELRNGKMKVAYPVFVDGTSLAADVRRQGRGFRRPRLPDRRQSPRGAGQADPRVARVRPGDREPHVGAISWATASRSRSTTSARTTRRRTRSCSDQLGQSFRDAGFDLKQAHAVDRALRAVQPEQPDHRAATRSDDPTLGAKPMFSRFYLRQMEAEQLYESLLVATAADNTLAERRARRHEGPLAPAVQHGLRHRRQRRVDHVQRLDSAGADADERRAGAAGDRQPAGQHAVPRGRRPEDG